ncbi:MAG: 3-hydroxyacyl-CoA dehydrogenase [candidate division KSB1 bacterium]|nr:3-hydroxyacyl-CoA dehydrogenase [candidate division KSB1 bacterium]MDZ7375357.1 3-hydroxyacyl-CoA dehydrogenase [candidate division KSB1 bacterium]MDZ7399518.1 3-hydroxyacyl-CoA dehydrogenase [candidate division KSB1 bacterium]
MYIYKAAVVGGGTMGGSIAQVITFSGIPVVIKDINQEAVQKALDKVRSIYESRVKKGKMTASEIEPKIVLASGTTSYDDFSDVDIVIEAVPEDIKIKKQVFRELDEVCPPSTILATNTSALSISEIAAATKRPEKVIGMHFFNPAHVMKLVEVIPGLQTSEETVMDVMAFAESLRKLAVRVEECPGFLVNRLLMPYITEAVIALTEGAATATEIDQAMVNFGMPMGPFTLSDMLGLDVCYKVAQIMYNAYGPRMPVASLNQKMFEKGRLGQKTGAGFYDADGSEKELQAIVKEIQQAEGLKKTTFSPERLLYIMINEAVLVLQEKIASATDIDIAMMAGTGFPQELGGPLKYADKIGLDVVLEGLEKFKDELGMRFWPAHLLKRMVAAGLLGEKTGRGFYTH